jgi:hypothetical protein
METDPIRYDVWVADALLGVMRRALEHSEVNGLVGDHHYFITFRTDADGLEIPGYLHAQHPEEMTIVLQHQFSDLRVGEDVFEVVLSFKGRAEYLRVPFDAVTSFADPSVNFGLQLKPAEESDEEQAEETQAESAGPAEPAAKSGQVIALDAFRKK